MHIDIYDFKIKCELSHWGIHKGAFTNDVIILEGEGLENMTQDGGLKMTSLFYIISEENFKQFDLKSKFKNIE